VRSSAKNVIDFPQNDIDEEIFVPCTNDIWVLRDEEMCVYEF
jgi:hypothetical protein